MVTLFSLFRALLMGALFVIFLPLLGWALPLLLLCLPPKVRTLPQEGDGAGPQFASPHRGDSGTSQ